MIDHATIKSGSQGATYRYAHHMGGGEYVPALGWAMFAGRPETRVEVSGTAFPGLDGGALAEKAVAILRHRRAA